MCPTGRCGQVSSPQAGGRQEGLCLAARPGRQCRPHGCGDAFLATRNKGRLHTKPPRQFYHRWHGMPSLRWLADLEAINLPGASLRFCASLWRWVGLRVASLGFSAAQAASSKPKCECMAARLPRCA